MSTGNVCTRHKGHRGSVFSTPCMHLITQLLNYAYAVHIEENKLTQNQIDVRMAKLLEICRALSTVDIHTQ